MENNKTLDEKRISYDYDGLHIPEDKFKFKDVKEFVEKLKIEMEDMKGRSKNEIIDELAGKGLIK